jgi:hypothetical protein
VFSIRIPLFGKMELDHPKIYTIDVHFDDKNHVRKKSVKNFENIKTKFMTQKAPDMDMTLAGIIKLFYMGTREHYS